jgi:hypothetical protein
MAFFQAQPVSGDAINLESGVIAQIHGCLALARAAKEQVDFGERLTAARAVVELVVAYDKVRDTLVSIPLSDQQRKSMETWLSPVAELLRKYRLR